MDRIFRGKRVEDIRLVEVVVGARVVLLPLKPSLQIADHSPEDFNWGYEGRGPAQLSLGILYEVTGNVALVLYLPTKGLYENEFNDPIPIFSTFHDGAYF